MNPLHRELMTEALTLAERAIDLGEAPIACVIAMADGKIVGWGWNELNAKRDKTAHAEMAAFRDAAGRYPLDYDKLILVSTLEPCVMCFGASLLSGVGEIVYAVRAPADGGLARVKPPEGPGSKTPSVVDDVMTREAIALFQRWLERHTEEGPQREYIQELMKLNGEASD